MGWVINISFENEVRLVGNKY